MLKRDKIKLKDVLYDIWPGKHAQCLCNDKNGNKITRNNSCRLIARCSLTLQ